MNVPQITPEDHATLLDLIARGVLVGVQVFGTDACCEHGEEMFQPGDVPMVRGEPCPACGFGLCDVFGPCSVGSDCNSAERFLMRPSHDLFSDELHEALNREDQP